MHCRLYSGVFLEQTWNNLSYLTAIWMPYPSLPNSVVHCWRLEPAYRRQKVVASMSLYNVCPKAQVTPKPQKTSNGRSHQSWNGIQLNCLPLITPVQCCLLLPNRCTGTALREVTLYMHRAQSRSGQVEQSWGVLSSIPLHWRAVHTASPGGSRTQVLFCKKSHLEILPQGVPRWRAGLSIFFLSQRAPVKYRVMSTTLCHSGTYSKVNPS